MLDTGHFVNFGKVVLTGVVQLYCLTDLFFIGGRSARTSRSNCASADISVNSSLPVLEVVLMDSFGNKLFVNDEDKK